MSKPVSPYYRDSDTLPKAKSEVFQPPLLPITEVLEQAASALLAERARSAKLAEALGVFAAWDEVAVRRLSSEGKQQLIVQAIYRARDALVEYEEGESVPR